MTRWDLHSHPENLASDWDRRVRDLERRLRDVRQQLEWYRTWENHTGQGSSLTLMSASASASNRVLPAIEDLGHSCRRTRSDAEPAHDSPNGRTQLFAVAYTLSKPLRTLLTSDDLHHNCPSSSVAPPPNGRAATPRTVSRLSPNSSELRMTIASITNN